VKKRRKRSRVDWRKRGVEGAETEYGSENLVEGRPSLKAIPKVSKGKDP